MAKKLSEFKLDQDEFDAGTRGEWRRFNPSNPFSNQINNTNEQDLKVESLDDLFSDDITGGNNTDQVEPLNMLNNKASINSTNRHWMIGDTDTGVVSEGKTPYIGDNGNWFIDDVDTGDNRKIVLKVILETCYLTDDEVVKACIASKNAGADFVKTSTGFGTPKAPDGTALPNGASVHHVQLMKKTVGDSMKIKAAGGIRSVRTAEELIKAGADRLGTSSGLLIYQNWED